MVPIKNNKIVGSGIENIDFCIKMIASQIVPTMNNVELGIVNHSKWRQLAIQRWGYTGDIGPTNWKQR